jgi:hypothetical protein
MTQTSETTYLDIDGNTTVGAAYDLLVAELERLGLFDELDYFSTTHGLNKSMRFGDVLPGHYSWIACWAVPGNSEGHYIHVELVGESERWEDKTAGRKLSRCVFSGKTFQGFPHALAVANALTIMLSWA